MVKQTLEQVEAQLDEMRKKHRALGEKISRKVKQRDCLFIEANAENFEDIEWLVNNPDSPGQHKALCKWMEKEYGGEYNGVTSSGYYPSINQQSFGFRVTDCHGVEKPEYVTNIKKFVANVLPFLKPVEDGFIEFSYKTGQYSGVFSIDYRKKDGTWWTSNTVYGRKRDKRMHDSLDGAIAFAIVKSGEVYD